MQNDSFPEAEIGAIAYTANRNGCQYTNNFSLNPECYLLYPLNKQLNEYAEKLKILQDRRENPQTIQDDDSQVLSDIQDNFGLLSLQNMRNLARLC